MSEGAQIMGVSRCRYERERQARLEAEKLLEEKSRELYAAQQARTQFLSLISHELKTPINGVLGAGQALVPLSGGEVSPHVQTLLNCGQSLNILVDTLICLAQIDTHRLELVKEPFSVCTVIDNVAAAFGPVASGKGLALVKSCLNHCQELHVVGDMRRLQQILTIIASNAVKFTDSGEVTLGAEIAEGRVQFWVSDTGPGVDEEDRERIFRRFVQGEDFNHRSSQGAGVGLSLARELVEMMGGRISVTDAASGGARFNIDLSLPTVCPVEAKKIRRTGKSARGLHVLVVDDLAINRFVAETAVKAAGMTCEMAENGQQAIDMLEEKQFDIVLMDIQMPVMTGDEAIRWIRAADRAYRQIPIIVISAHIGPDDDFMAIGANQTMSKPVNFEELVGCIEGVMDQAA